MSKKINKGRLFRNTVLLILILGSAGVYFSNRFVKSKGFEGLGDFISNYRANRNLAANVTPQSIKLLLDDKDYKFIENKRRESLDRGIQVNKGDNYVDCKVVHQNDTLEGEIRLKGHMTDHLEGEKWSFRVKTDGEVMGMYRFSLQHPGTRNYVYEWIYHQLLKREGIIRLKYDFINLSVNEKDLGIYAIEEHFGQHILRDNERPKGAILRWNPELYWEHRLDELDGVYLDEGYSGYSATFAEAYDKGVVKKDEVLVETYQKGAALLEAFRRGDKKTSAVFDIEKMAGFHAVIDLVGGYHSLDWSDVKFYYNSETEKIEPVGYESFSVRETVKIAGQRTPEDYRTNGFDYHDRLFADPDFFAAYIAALERIADAAYFDAFTQTIEDSLNLKRGVLAHEYAYIKFSFRPYYENIERIQHNLNLPKAFHAFLEGNTDTTALIAVTPVSDYPIEIKALVVDGKKEFSLAAPFVLPPKARDTYARYFDIEVPYDGKKLKKLTLKAAIPGSQAVFEVNVSDLPSYQMYKEKSVPETLNTADSLLVWLNDSTLLFADQKVQVNSLLTVPENATLYVNQGQDISFGEEGRLTVSGELKLLGSDEYPIQVSGKGNQPFVLMNEGSLTAVNVVFSNLESEMVYAQNSTLSFQKCQMADIDKELILAVGSSVRFVDCASGKLESLGGFDRCQVKIKSFSAINGGTFIKAFGSDIEMYASKIEGYKLCTALNYSSDFSCWNSQFSEIELLGELNNHSVFNCFSGSVENGKQGFKVDLNSELAGDSQYLLYKTDAAIAVMEERREG